MMQNRPRNSIASMRQQHANFVERLVRRLGGFGGVYCARMDSFGGHVRAGPRGIMSV